jgi:hypothetical protein
MSQWGNGQMSRTEPYLSNEEVQMAKKHMKNAHHPWP